MGGPGRRYCQRGARAWPTNPERCDGPSRGANNAGGQLVNGGHTIRLAMLEVTRALPNLVTILSWHSCDHLGPVREGDTLRSSIELERRLPLSSMRCSAAGEGGARGSQSGRA